MSEKPTNQKLTDALKRLMVQLPERRGLSLKAAGKLCHIELYKYRHEDIIPLTRSLYIFGETFRIKPFWLLMMATCIVEGLLTEAQALEILNDWPTYQPDFEHACKYAIQKAVEKGIS
jgi:hypothetical protein